MYKRYRTNLLLAIFTLLCYVCVLLPPAWWFMFGFFALMIPLMLLINGISMVYWLFYKQYIKSLISFSALLVGFPFLQATFHWNFYEHTPEKKNFSVLSYNVRVFNAFRKKDEVEGKQIVYWSKYDRSAIKCFQEFYYQPRSETFNTLQTLTKRDKYHYFFKPSFIDKRGGQFGLAIFSTFPIIHQGEVEINDNSYNDAIYIDVLIHGDTLRVYNIHLYSMKINAERMKNTDRNNFKENIKDLTTRLRNGFVARTTQIDAVLTHIQQCPYPMIVCGDLNDVPYSYSYFRLRGLLHNTFEQVGKGFGFSYNSSWLLIRIDNQFHSTHLKAHDFYTHQEVNYSDHYPIKATYSFSNK